MTLRVHNGKIFISQSNMNKLYHGSKKVWEVLRDEGAEILIRGESGQPVRLPKEHQPYFEVVGIDLLEQKERYLSTWDHKFLETIPTTGEKRRVKECRVQGIPVLVAKEKH